MTLNQGSGPLPAEYMEYKVMREMGWSYRELMECPRDMFYDIVRYLNTEAKYQQERK